MSVDRARLVEALEGAPLELVKPNTLEAAPFEVRQLATALRDKELSRPVDWILERFFVRHSLNVVYGAGKLGKSTMLAYLAICVACGVPFAGLKTFKGRVLWIDLEQGPRRLMRSLGVVPGAQSEELAFDVYSDLTDRGRSISALAATLRAGEYVLVVVDSLGKFAQIADENDNGAWQRALQLLEELARSLPLALVFIDHDRKSEGEHGRGLRGASSKLAAMDCAVHMKRVASKDTVRRLEIVSRESGTFVLDINLGANGFEGTTRTVEPVEQALQGGSMSMTALIAHLKAKGFNTSRGTIRNRIDALVGRGHVVTSGEGTKADPHMFTLVGNSDIASNCQNASTEDE